MHIKGSSCVPKSGRHELAPIVGDNEVQGRFSCGDGENIDQNEDVEE